MQALSLLGRGRALLEYRDIYAGGRLVGSASADVITIVNPATEEVVGAVPSAVGVDVDRAVRSARRAFDDGTCATRPPADRADALRRGRAPRHG
jgi:aldehyde dehydrogenase (NAD+)